MTSRRCDLYGEVGCTREDHLDSRYENGHLKCIDSWNGGCQGGVELRMALSGTGIPYPRCERHWALRLDREAELRQRYPEHPPSDWSPLDAGESWYEEES